MNQKDFRRQSLEQIFANNNQVIDIGGGLRADPKRNNRYDPEYADFIIGKNYLVLDKEDTYHPDIVGDVHKLPFEDNSVDGLLCLSVLEHVEDPFLAMREMHRVLKPGAGLFIYVPFLFYYHAHEGYYSDYWRFTGDGLRVLAKPFTSCEVRPTRGAIETLVHLVPKMNKLAHKFAFLDTLFHKAGSRQTAGYEAFCIK